MLMCFQDDLNDAVSVWNCHKIRPNHNQQLPHGRPTVMYNAPASYQRQDFLIPVTERQIEACEQACIFIKDAEDAVDQDIFQLAVILMNEGNIQVPTKPSEAIDLYIYLYHEMLMLSMLT